VTTNRLTEDFALPDDIASFAPVPLGDFDEDADAQFVSFPGLRSHTVVTSPIAHSLSFVLGGKGRIAWTVGGKTRHTLVLPGGYSIVPQSSDDNVFDVEGSVASLHIRLHPGFLAKSVEGELDRSVSGLEILPTIRSREPRVAAIYEALAAELRAPGLATSLYVDTLVVGLVVQLVRSHSNLVVAEGPRVRALSAGALQTATDFIQANLAANLRLRDIAGAVGLSPHHFAKMFKAAIGQAPHAYVLEQRIVRAKHLLARGEWSIADVAYQVGFSSQSHLTTVFRRLCGATPQQYRRVLGRSGRIRTADDGGAPAAAGAP
jgi:AraC family transcriptional regulator